jgi:hypothetical protein
MKIRTTLALWPLLLAPAIASQDPVTRPADADAERAQDARDKTEKKGERAQDARDKTEKKGERVQDARDKKTAKRVQNARDKAQDPTGKGQGDGTKDDPTRLGGERVKGARKADGAKNAAAQVKALTPAQRNATLALVEEIRTHEKTVARIDKLAAIYTDNGDAERLERVQSLRVREDARYEKTIARYENLLGNERFSTVRRRLESAKPALPKKDGAKKQPVKKADEDGSDGKPEKN